VFAFFRSPTLIGGASFTGVHPLFRQVTFQRGTVWAARFAPGGQTMIYTATWNGGPLELYGLRQTSPESRSFDLPNRKLLSISSKGEMAILRPAAYLYQFIHRGTLARVPIEGGGPREIAENIQEADWTPEGREMAVVRWVEGRNRLEFPIGNSLVETTGYISNPRFSPNGETIAFLDHERQWDNRGTVSVVDIHGNKKALTEEFSGLEGLAWHPMTGEIWFTGSQNGEAYALYAVNTDGLTRLVERAPADLMLFDISADGRVLMARAEQATDIYGSLPGVPDKNLSWLKLVGIADIAETGKSFLFTHFGEGSGKNYSVYLRETDGSPAVRIGEGRALELSRDGKFIIAKISSPEELVIHPVGAGEIKHIPKGPIEHYTRATWFSDGLRILFAGNEPGKGRRCYIQAVDSEVITPVTPEGLTGSILSPDDKWLVANDVNGRKLLFNLENGETRPIKNLDNADEVIRWDDRGKTIYVYRPLEYPIRIFRLDPETGRREPIKEITPLDPAGIIGNPYVFMTADGKKFVYGLRRYLYDLYLTEGLK
jgi:dipeptidyl aminopeptidase/acylaminoacyl peptidase